MNAKVYKVILPVDPNAKGVPVSVGKRPGLLACGDLRPGKEYPMPAAEALRLVDTKGFEFVNKEDEQTARAELKADADKKAPAPASATEAPAAPAPTK